MRLTHTCLISGLVISFGLLASPTRANEPEPAVSIPITLEFSKPLGIEHYRLDHKTKMTGWKLSPRWYLGRQKGADSGLTLVWQRTKDQVSVSKDGLRFTRRF
jgi:hypothetical protein